MFSLSMRYAWPAIQCVMFYLLVGGGRGLLHHGGNSSVLRMLAAYRGGY